jgi:hypothetical protein
MESRVFLGLVLVLSASIIACGSSGQGMAAGSTGNGGAHPTGSTGTGSAQQTGSGGSGGALEAGTRGLFDCNGCMCDGATHYCKITLAGAAPSHQEKPPPGPDGCTDADAGAPDGCIPLPSTCLPDPACTCIEANALAWCACSDESAGLKLTCMLP